MDQQKSLGDCERQRRQGTPLCRQPDHRRSRHEKRLARPLSEVQEAVSGKQTGVPRFYEEKSAFWTDMSTVPERH